MTYHDPDSGLDFPSYDDYMKAWLGEDSLPSDAEICEDEGHPYAGDEGNLGRCYCGAQAYVKGGLRKKNE